MVFDMKKSILLALLSVQGASADFLETRDLGGSDNVDCGHCNHILDSNSNSAVILDMKRASKSDRPTLSTATITNDGDVCGALCVEVALTGNSDYLKYDKDDEHFVKINGKKMADGKHSSFIKYGQDGDHFTGWKVCFPVPSDVEMPYDVKIHTLAYESAEGKVQTSATVNDSIDLCLKCSDKLTYINDCPVSTDTTGAPLTPPNEDEECYPLTSSQSCSNEAVCEEINGHTYYTLHKWHDESCETKCAAEADLDFLLSASEGYSCGKCEDGDDLPPTVVEACYIIDEQPEIPCLDEMHTCDMINGHTYYKVHLPSQGSDSCETKCVAQSDLDFLRSEGYECGFCDSESPDLVVPTTPEPTTAAPTTPEPTTAAPTNPEPTTATATTPEPTNAPTTLAPTTAAPTTPEPTTAAPTNPEPTTATATTPEPTNAPTTLAPTTAAPTTLAPNASPTAAPTIVVDNIVPGDVRTGKRSGQGGGDPHFKTWSGIKFDYHGECDLVLIDNPSFMNNLGLRLDIRTIRVGYFSYIERVALQIGSDVLEFANDVDNYLLNGAVPTEKKVSMAGFEVRRYRRAVSVRLDESAKAKIDFYVKDNGMPYFNVDAGGTDMFEGSAGLLGDWETGQFIARDGMTVLGEPEAHALEWQVRDTEPMLFQSIRAPQFPATCLPPQKMLGKRLGDTHMRAKAEQVCAAQSGDFDNCIFDVMATRSVSAAEEIVDVDAAATK